MSKARRMADRAVTERRLANGLRLVLAPDDTAAEVAVTVWYQVGSGSDPPRRSGLAHLVEHMMFQGSRHVAAGKHQGLIRSLGGRCNATTWLDRTVYSNTAPARWLETVLWLEGNRMAHVREGLSGANLQTQLEVVKQERNCRYDSPPYGTWREMVYSQIFPNGHPYHRPTIGSMADLSRLCLADVDGFLASHYLPNNAIVAVAGGFDIRRVINWTSAYLGGIAEGRVPARPQLCLAPTIGREVRGTVSAPVPTRRAFLGYRGPALGSGEWEALSLATRLLARGPQSRLNSRLMPVGRVAGKAWIGLIDAFGVPAVTGWVIPAEDVDQGAVRRAFHETVEDLGLSGPTEGEIGRAIAGLELDRLAAHRNLEERAYALCRNAAFFGDACGLNPRFSGPDSVNPQQIMAAAGKYLTARNRVVLEFVPGPAGQVVRWAHQREPLLALGVGQSELKASP